MTQVGELVDNQKRSVSCELRKSNDRITPSEKIHATQRYEVKWPTRWQFRWYRV
jgi:hypothetical protein